MSLPRRIPRVHGLCAEQIEPRGYAADGAAVLLDQFGRAHPLADGMVVGREPGEPGLAVIEASVSRRHAELRRVGDRWQLADLESTNGTFVDGLRVREPVALAEGQLVVIGDVGFVFYSDGASVNAQRDTESIRATVASSVPAEVEIKLAEPSGGGGGYAEYQGKQVQLGVAQFALLSLLARRFLEERGEPEEVRGFVRSTELLADLPWNTPFPTDNHLKQLVRRVRRALERIGLADVIESRQRFGYRLQVGATFD